MDPHTAQTLPNELICDLSPPSGAVVVVPLERGAWSTGPDARGHKTKYKLPEEPPRRAVLVVSPMSHTPNEDGHKISLKEITSSLMKELGIENEEDGREPKEIQV